MIRLILGALAAAAIAAPALAEPASEPSDVRDAARAFDAAQLHNDRATLDRMIADDLVFVRGSGVLAGKAEFLSSFGSASLQLQPFEVTHPTYVQLGPDAAMIGGEVTLRGTENGQAFAEHIRYTDTFQRRDGRWRVVHIQVTPIR